MLCRTAVRLTWVVMVKSKMKMEATQVMMMAREQANPYNIIVKDEDGGHAGDDDGQGVGEPLQYNSQR